MYKSHLTETDCFIVT